MIGTRGYFFRAPQLSGSYTTNVQEFCVQVPSIHDLEQMHQMPAGGDEDQYQRLTNMADSIKKLKQKHPSLHMMTTDHVNLPGYWLELFAAIKAGNEPAALTLFGQIPPRDALLQALLCAHEKSYLHNLVSYSSQARPNNALELNSDITITSGAFEVLVKDFATTLFHAAKVHFSFGLPTHHAFSSDGSGFCLLDKTTALMKHKENISHKPLKYVVIGTDVNRDNGLNYNLMNLASHQQICHVDIFDSRVYPGQNHADIKTLLGSNGVEVGQKIKCWSVGAINYFAVDLRLTTRTNDSIHPALTFALEKMDEQIKAAKAGGQKIMIMLPTGWDSHQDETAPCGKSLNGRMMSQNEAEKTRFNDKDLRYFYERVFDMYLENKNSIEGMYWGLEGGYNRPMYEKQIQLLMSIALEKLTPGDVLGLIPGKL